MRDGDAVAYIRTTSTSIEPKEQRQMTDTQLRVICPYAGVVHPDTDRALREQAPHAELIDVGGSPTAYWSLLAETWADGVDFLLVEQDIVIPPGAIDRLASCQNPWCSLAPEISIYPFVTRDTPALLAEDVAALTANRFRGDVMRRHPDVFSRVPQCCRHWSALAESTLRPLEVFDHEPVCVHYDLQTLHAGIRDRDIATYIRRHREWQTYIGEHGGHEALKAAGDRYAPVREAYEFANRIDCFLKTPEFRRLGKTYKESHSEDPRDAFVALAQAAMGAADSGADVFDAVVAALSSTSAAE